MQRKIAIKMFWLNRALIQRCRCIIPSYKLAIIVKLQVSTWSKFVGWLQCGSRCW